ncbi:MAG TPA: hypothetical protein VIQ31_27315 [Phormidium sp.]|nr:hypothetical protein [Microcoleus sp. FACHB-68]
MILTKQTKAIISAAGISLVLLALTAGASLAAEGDSQTSGGCPCCKEMMKEGSH